MDRTIVLSEILTSINVSPFAVLAVTGVSLRGVLGKRVVSLFAVLASLGFHLWEYSSTYPFAFLSINRKTAGKYEIQAIAKK